MDTIAKLLELKEKQERFERLTRKENKMNMQKLNEANALLEELTNEYNELQVDFYYINKTKLLAKKAKVSKTEMKVEREIEEEIKRMDENNRKHLEIQKPLKARIKDRLEKIWDRIVEEAEKFGYKITD